MPARNRMPRVNVSRGRRLLASLSLRVDKSALKSVRNELANRENILKRELAGQKVSGVLYPGSVADNKRFIRELQKREGQLESSISQKEMLLHASKK